MILLLLKLFFIKNVIKKFEVDHVKACFFIEVFYNPSVIKKRNNKLALRL